MGPPHLILGKKMKLILYEVLEFTNASVYIKVHRLLHNHLGYYNVESCCFRFFLACWESLFLIQP
jgi:hypothetical protein